MVELSDRYILTSNRESGFGRYDVMLEPLYPDREDGITIEFKVFQPKKEKDLEDTVKAALKQIDEKKYDASLIVRGIPGERIHRYGFAFRGKEVVIGEKFTLVKTKHLTASPFSCMIAQVTGENCPL